MSYGYCSEVMFTRAVNDIDDEAAMLLDRLAGERQDDKTRPIIFISHNLGGIIMKKVISGSPQPLPKRTGSDM